MTNEIVLIHCLFPWNIFTLGLANDTRHCIPMLSYP
jgi:hypothetical protein